MHGIAYSLYSLRMSGAHLSMCLSMPAVAMLLNVVSSPVSKLKKICTLNSLTTCISMDSDSIVLPSCLAIFSFPLNRSRVTFTLPAVSSSTEGTMPNQIVSEKSFLELTVFR
ncbi:hypothetical protein D1872_243760 [compost metagenome]